MLDEILVIRESIPIFYYNRDPNKALNDDHYVLQSGFFVALSAFANELSNDKLKYVVLENKLYALDEISDIMLVFGDKEKMSDEVIQNLQQSIVKATNHLTQIITKHDLSAHSTNQYKINAVADDFGEYLKNENLVEDDSPFDPLKSRTLMQKFIFKSIGYVPGQCNIGPAERLKRLIIGIFGFVVGIIGGLVIYFTGIPSWYMFLLAIPFLMGFFGTFQYFFKFCAVNGITKQYDMK
ncbi:MAG: hypothetical protein ACTSO7_06250 [Candidatus Heimdallarchaeota archaeon]